MFGKIADDILINRMKRTLFSVHCSWKCNNIAYQIGLQCAPKIKNRKKNRNKKETMKVKERLKRKD